MPSRPARTSAASVCGRSTAIFGMSSLASPRAAVPLDVIDDDRRPRRVEAGHRNLRAPRLAVRLRVHERNHAARIREPGAAREAAHYVEEVQRVEVDLLVERLHRRDLLLIDRQAVVRLAEREVDGQLAEERRVFRARLAFAERHHVIVERRQRLRLEPIPEPLGIGRDPLVDRGAAGDVCLDPAGGHAHAFVVREAIEERRARRSPARTSAAAARRRPPPWRRLRRPASRSASSRTGCS